MMRLRYDSVQAGEDQNQEEEEVAVVPAGSEGGTDYAAEQEKIRLSQLRRKEAREAAMARVAAAACVVCMAQPAHGSLSAC
jgi:hypothetical protein